MSHNMKGEYRVRPYGHEALVAREVTVDPDGDLYLRIGERSGKDGLDTSKVSKALFKGSVHVHPRVTEFLVDSKALSRASPVFSRMLNGGFAESLRPDSSTGEKWVVRLPEDDIKAMSMLLHIMHCRFEHPQRLTDSFLLRHFYQIAIATDKYCCTHLVQPWIIFWLIDMATCYFPTASCHDWQMISWIAWEYGSQEILEVAFQRLLWEAGQHSVYFSNVLEPTGLQGTTRPFIVIPIVES